MSTNTTPMYPLISEQPLTGEQGQQLMQAIARYHELQGKTIFQPKEEAERAGLAQFLARELILHSSELVGCWAAVIREYQPLVLGIRHLFARAGLTAPQQQQPATEEAALVPVNNAAEAQAADSAKPTN